MEKVKVLMIAVISTVMSFLGILALPVFVLLGCNIIDYSTGIVAAPYRKEKVKSYKSVKGIAKKVCMWLLIFVGWMMDMMIQYWSTTAGINMQLPFNLQIQYVIATIVASWLIVNEIISILENMIDIGVDMPPFLMPIVKRIKYTMEDKANINNETKRTNENRKEGE